MSTNDLENQSALAAEDLSADVPAETAVPDVKSGVRVDRETAAMQLARFYKNDIIHMSQVNNGQRVRGQYTVLDRRYNSQGGYVEYQLMGALSQQLYPTWVRERDLKLDKRG